MLPDLASVCFLIDALRRLKSLAKGTMHIETWQLAWHIWSFASVVVAGVLLSVSTINAWDNPTWFYITYEGIVVVMFMCELPFIYIINKIVSQALFSKQREDHTNRNPSELSDEDLQRALQDERIDRDLEHQSLSDDRLDESDVSRASSLMLERKSQYDGGRSTYNFSDKTTLIESRASNDFVHKFQQ